MTDRPLPDRPVPDREGRDEGFSAGAAEGHHGMTRTALALLVFLMLLCGWRVHDFWDSHQPPSGVTTQEATVLGSAPIHRAGSRPDRNASIWFELPDGTQESALYELRWFGRAEKGDTITVYERDGLWRTTSEQSVGGVLWWGAGLALVLVMTYGWFRVRGRARRGLPAL